MYEARQNKERGERTLFSLKRKNGRQLLSNVINPRCNQVYAWSHSLQFSNNLFNQTKIIQCAKDVFDENNKMQPGEQYGIFVGSNTEELFSYNLPDKMTYHHIIPRNILADFWNRMKENGQLSLFCQKDGFKNLLIETKKRIDNRNSYLLELIEKEDNSFTKERLKRNMSSLFEVDGVIVSDSKLIERLSLLDEVNDKTDDELRIIGQIFQWWPANIHHGPTNRCKGGEEGDGENNFEESAKYIVREHIFSSLKQIYIYTRWRN